MRNPCHAYGGTTHARLSPAELNETRRTAAVDSTSSGRVDTKRPIPGFFIDDDNLTTNM